MEANLYSIDGSVLGKFPLTDKLFNQKINEHLIWEVLKSYQANQRQGSVSTKTRAEVSGGGRKPWRQKGTGRARHGSIRSPIWVGGGIVFGPKPRDYRIDIPKKKRRQALLMALSDRARENKIIIIDELKVAEPKTKIMANFINKLNLSNKKILILTDKIDRNSWLASQNIPNLTLDSVNSLNALKVLSNEYVILTKGAYEQMEKR